MTNDDWHHLPLNEKRAFIQASIDRFHESQYLAALRMANTTGPAWADLTEEARQNVRNEVRRFQLEMDELGKSLRN